MPIYEYRCEDCEKEMEVVQRFSDPPLEECPECGGRLKKLISNTSFILKGTGWYITDYPSKERKKAMEQEKKLSSDNSEKKDKKKEPAKT